MAQPDLYDGHQEAHATWREALAGPRMHHAWLLAGKRGLGKAAFAMAVARELVAIDGVRQPDGQHPDIVLLTHLPKDDKEQAKRDEGKAFESKRNITIDQVRAMQHRLTTRPTLGLKRAVVIDPADDLERGAANALLKSLEEPPEGTHFLLVAHRPARLLPTIRSRCRLLRFPALEDEQVAAILQRDAGGVDAAARAAAVSAARGSPGMALDFVHRKLGPAALLLRRIAKEGDAELALRGELLAAVGARPDRETLPALLDLARSILADDIRAVDTPRQSAIIEAHTALVRLSGQVAGYNFDPTVLTMEIGGLLAKAAALRDPADG